MIRVPLIFLLGLLVSAVQAQSLPPQLKSAVRQTIETGGATVMASEAMSDAIHRSMGRAGGPPLRISMTRLQTFGPECARINMQFAHVIAEPLFAMQMNLCKDGTAPLEGVDLAEPVAPPQATSIPRLRRLQEK